MQNSRPAMKKAYLICAAIIIVVAVWSVYSRREAEPVSDGISREGALIGKTACLPHKDKKGPQTLECAFALKAEDGEYYALDSQKLSEEDAAALNSSQGRVSVKGLIVPADALSAEMWQRYDFKGIMQVEEFEAI